MPRFLFLLVPCLFVAAASAAPSDAVVLFDGRDVSKLQALDKAWQVADGVLSAGEGKIQSRQHFANYELRLEYELPPNAGDATLHLHDAYPVELPKAADNKPQVVELSFETLPGKSPNASLWHNGKQLFADRSLKAGAEGAQAGGPPKTLSAAQSQTASMSTGKNFSIAARFRSKGDGTIFSKAMATGAWVADAKAVFLRGGKLVYDIGWLGAISTAPKVNDNQWHVVVLTSTAEGDATLYLDGKEIGSKRNFSTPDKDNFRFKIGEAAKNFGGDFSGHVDYVRYYPTAWSADAVAKHAAGGKIAEPAVAWQGPPPTETPQAAVAGRSDNGGGAWVPFQALPGEAGPLAVSASGPGLKIRQLWIRPLIDVDARSIIADWNEESFARGAEIYAGLCVTCHGTQQQAGSLPTALKFHEGQFKNGSDPIGMYRTLTHGFGQMVPQNWMSPSQKFDVIHYLREAMLKTDNPSQYVAVDAAYLAGIPRAAKVPKVEAKPQKRSKQYLEMNYGSSLMWTLEVDKDHNIVQKGIITRLDDGPGGIVKGSVWAVFDHDLLQWGAAWSGQSFVNWRGIAFDGSHGTHTGLSGERLFTNPQAPGWANPASGSWEDPRIQGRDTDRRFGPLPRDWAHYQGTYKHGNARVIAYTIGSTRILEQASVIYVDGQPAMLRTMNFDAVTKPLKTRLAPSTLTAVVTGGNYPIETIDDHLVMTIPVGAKQASILIGKQPEASLRQQLPAATDLTPLTKGGPPQWLQPVTSEIARADDDAAYVVDTLTIPHDNPFKSWMRLSGFDFYPGGKSLLVCTWQGDVWRVDGVDQAAGTLVWRRIASGLFQPLGLKIVDGQIYVGCRDQIVRLHDLNGDGEIDFYENFNNDHQVTEHFHEFAMGLQTDAAGNFYYAKSARHAKTAVVPHHGTLLRVSKDGSKTDILAHGFRAANGVCVNPDGSFFVTDQEGHWTPKNRINWVTADNKFYGNYMGYHDAPGPEDKYMEEPMIWLTNKFNRSPGELMWATSDRWGPLHGQLLELSYGMGRIHLNLQEKVDGIRQGGQVKLPIPDFDTGIMRGRFSPADGQLYALGMFAWAGNKQQPGNFHRIRYTGKPVLVPTALRTGPDYLEIDFPTAVDSAKSTFEVSSWHIARSRNYGSKHQDEKKLAVSAVEADANGRTLRLQIKDLAPTRCMSIKGSCTTADGSPFTFEINNTIHRLNK